MDFELRNYNTNFKKGNYPPIPNCRGPVEEIKGTDRPCCLNCATMKKYILREDKSCFFSNNKYLLDYINESSKFIDEIYTAFSISTCNNDYPTIFYSNEGGPELDPSSYYKTIFNQIKLLHSWGVLIKNYTTENFSFTRRSIPIYVPNFDDPDNVEFRDNYGGDEGIEFYTHSNNNNVTQLFRVTDEKAAYKSGKWLHLIKFYEIMITVFNVKKKFEKKIIHGKSINEPTNYFIIPQNLLNHHVPFTKIKVDFKNKPLKLEKIQGESTDKYAVIDLDNTLIYSVGYDIMDNNEVKDRVFYIKLISRKTHYRVVLRKHVFKFLLDLKKLGYKLIVWSAGWKDYVDKIVSEIFKDIDFTYVLKRTVQDEVEYKNLNKIGDYIENFNINNCRLVDDKDLHAKNQEKHVILVPCFRFKGDFPIDEEDDNVLETLAEKVHESFNKN